MDAIKGKNVIRKGDMTKSGTNRIDRTGLRWIEVAVAWQMIFGYSILF
jgi:hypothetical protein